MAHAPGVGYSQQGPPAAKVAAPSAPAPNPAPAAAPSSSAADGGGDIDLSGFSIPGGNTAEKALLVVGILLLGIAFYGRVSGKTLNLALQGLAPGAASSASTQSVAQQSRAALTIAMAQRTSQANPARVGA